LTKPIEILRRLFNSEHCNQLRHDTLRSQASESKFDQKDKHLWSFRRWHGWQSSDSSPPVYDHLACSSFRSSNLTSNFKCRVTHRAPGPYWYLSCSMTEASILHTHPTLLNLHNHKAKQQNGPSLEAWYLFLTGVDPYLLSCTVNTRAAAIHMQKGGPKIRTLRGTRRELVSTSAAKKKRKIAKWNWGDCYHPPQASLGAQVASETKNPCLAYIF
jgi:hypothetical protein